MFSVDAQHTAYPELQLPQQPAEFIYKANNNAAHQLLKLLLEALKHFL